MKIFVFPGNIEEDILQIGAEQIPYMRTAAFSNIVKETERWMLQLIECTHGRVIPYTASGTGAMDAVIANVVTKKKKAFIVSGGSFGDRWMDLCQYYHCPYELFEVPFAKDMDYKLLEQQVARTRPDVFLCQHHETSTGQLFDLEKISAICSKYKVTFIVDAISSFLADPLKMDDWGIDICILSSQKGLNIPPGLSFVVLSEKMLKEGFSHKGYYFDFEENLKNLERGQTPYSPATTLFLQLHARLKQLSVTGSEAVIEKVKNRAQYFRKLCINNGWEIPAEVPSNAITSFFVHRNGDILFTELLKKNICILPCGTPSFFRVSHLGVQTFSDLEELAACIKEIEHINQ